jgi:hypothetical protein
MGECKKNEIPAIEYSKEELLQEFETIVGQIVTVHRFK